MTTTGGGTDEPGTDSIAPRDADPFDPDPDDVRKHLPPTLTEDPVWTFVAVAGVIFSAYHVFYGFGRYTAQSQHTIASVGLALLVLFALQLSTMPRGGRRGRLTVGLLLAMISVTVVATAYFYGNFVDLQSRVLLYYQHEYVLAALICAVVIEGTRRAYGNVLAGTIVSLLGYAYFAPLFPGPLRAEGLNFVRIIESSVLTLEGGIFGFIPQVGATWVVIFLVYAGLLEGYGIVDAFVAFAQFIGKRTQSGTAQIAVVSSLLMGSITGSAAANTATTGSFTIPLMRKDGLRAETAGAIESVASSGGQVLPPIMGASAFVMASILNLPYVEVIQIAILPALLFYLGIAVSTHVVSLKQGIDTGSTQTFEPVNRTRAIPLVTSIGVLVWDLAIRQVGPLTAGFHAIGVLTASQLLIALYVSGVHPRTLVSFGRDTLRGLLIGGTTAGPLMVALSGIAIMVQMISSVGLAQTLTFAMLDVSGSSLILLLLLAMLLSILFGMGMPTVAAYVLVAVLVGPAVTEFGISQPIGHMFVLYFAILSGLTPPFAIACVVACQIADSGFFETCLEAIKIGFPGFLLPFVFIAQPELLEWTANTPVTFGLVLIGFAGAIVAVNNYLSAPLWVPTRVGLLVASVFVLFSGTFVVQAAGAVIILGLGIESVYEVVPRHLSGPT